MKARRAHHGICSMSPFQYVRGRKVLGEQSFPYDDKKSSVLDDIGHLLDHFYRKQKHMALRERQTSAKVIQFSVLPHCSIQYHCAALGSCLCYCYEIT